MKIPACLLLTPLTSVSTVSSYPFVPWCPRISPSTQSWASAVMPQMHKSVQLIACGLWPHIQTRAATKKSFWRPVGFLEVPGSRWTISGLVESEVCGLWSGRGVPPFCHAVRSWKPLRFYQISGNDTSCPAAIERLIVGCCCFRRWFWCKSSSCVPVTAPAGIQQLSCYKDKMLPNVVNVLPQGDGLLLHQT